MLDGKRVLITGGTGSLGQVLVRRLFTGEIGIPESITVLSRDEAKQHDMQVAFADERLRFRIGDVANYHDIVGALRHADVVIHAAAMKQIPRCEYAPLRTVQTNIESCSNIIRAICDIPSPIETVAFISTDKACQPLNLYGMTKAVQERMMIQANLECDTRFVGVRYGNVFGSRGSIIPLFHDQIKRGGPVTVTTPEMTRFLMTTDEAVNTVFDALLDASRGEIYVPLLPASKIVDVANALIGDRAITLRIIGVRPGEKIHEMLISDDEAWRTVERGDYYVITPTLPELRASDQVTIKQAFCSADVVLDRSDVAKLIKRAGMRLEDHPVFL